jgi:hypothetical protein
MPEQPRRRAEPRPATYVYRRELEPRELIPAAAAAAGVALATFYVVRMFLQRTPIEVAGSQHERRVERRDRA